MWAEGGHKEDARGCWWGLYSAGPGSFETKLMDQAWPVTPVQVSQVSLGADTALGGDTPFRRGGPEGIFPGSPLPEARAPVTSPPGAAPSHSL